MTLIGQRARGSSRRALVDVGEHDLGALLGQPAGVLLQLGQRERRAGCLPDVGGTLTQRVQHEERGDVRRNAVIAYAQYNEKSWCSPRSFQSASRRTAAPRMTSTAQL